VALLPAAATAEAERDARTAITIATAIVGLSVSAAITAAIVWAGGVCVAAPVVRPIAAIAVMAIMPVMATTLTEIRGLLGDSRCGFRLYRVSRGVCSRTAEQCACTDGKNDS